MNNHGISLLLAITMLLPLTGGRAAMVEDTASVELPQPSTDLAPGEVVRIVIEALAHNDRPYANAGIEITFGFAAPSNRITTGPLDRFARMVKGPTYGIMIDHAASQFSEVVMTGDKAYQMVELTSADGRSTVFAFRLGKQLDGEYQGMWMTEAVWPVAVKDEPDQYF